MADTTTETETTETDDKASEETTTTETEDKPKGKDGTTFDPDRAQRAIEKAREAERKAKAEAKEAREKAAKYDELTEAQKSDLEKAEERAKRAEEKANSADSKLKRANLIAALADPKFGIVNARAAAKLIEGVEFDDEGEPTNLGSLDEEDSLISRFLTENDYLSGTPQKPKPPKTDARASGDDAAAPDLKPEELEAAKKYGMSPEEYAAFKSGGSLADIKAAGFDPSDKKD